MTPNDALVLLIAEMRIQMADADAQRDALAAKNEELHVEITARDAKILELEHHLAILERDAALHGISG